MTNRDTNRDTRHETHRLACEARYWLAFTERDPARIRQLLKRLKRKRSAANVERLAAAMRQHYRAAQTTH